MNPSQSNSIRIELRSGRVLEEIPRGRPRRRRRRVIQVTESAPPIARTQVSSRTSTSPPRQEDTMGDQVPPPPPPVRRMREYTLPQIVGNPSCIVLPPCDHHFEIKSSTLNILPSFNGTNQNPYDHLMEFEQACTTVKLNGLPEESLKLCLFPFTGRDNARRWLTKLPPRAATRMDRIGSWCSNSNPKSFGIEYVVPIPIPKFLDRIGSE